MLKSLFSVFAQSYILVKITLKGHKIASRFSIFPVQQSYSIFSFSLKAKYSRKMFGFNITPEAIVGPIIMLGAGWVVKNIKFTKFYLIVNAYIYSNIALPSFIIKL